MRKQESEKRLESTLRMEVEHRGGLAVKLTSQLHRGLPDRLILMPGGRTYFAEMKSTGESTTPLQRVMLGRLERLGFRTFVIDSTPDLVECLNTIDEEGRK